MAMNKEVVDSTESPLEKKEGSIAVIIAGGAIDS